jgi:hypothetical protein
MSEEFRNKRYTEIANMARKHGGMLKTRTYTFLHAPVKVECRHGHRFAITPKNILRGLWCVKCRPLPRQNEFLTAAQKVARANGGKCLSTAYENARKKLQWQCKSKHRWEASFDNVSNKESWCPECAAESASDRKVQWWRKRLSQRGRSKREQGVKR